MQSGNEAAQWAKPSIVSVPCLQFLSGILQAIKTRDKGRLEIAATVLVMAKNLVHDGCTSTSFSLTTPTLLHRCAQQGSPSLLVWRTRTTSAMLWYWTRMNTKQNTCSERWQRNALTWSGPFKWCGRFIFWGEAEREDMFRTACIGILVCVCQFMWQYTIRMCL